MEKHHRSSRTDFGTAVRVCRQNRSWTLREVAERMNERGFEGWTNSTVSKVESGTRPTTVEELIALADAFDVAPAMLLGPVQQREDELWRDVIAAGERMKVFGEVLEKTEALASDLRRDRELWEMEYRAAKAAWPKKGGD
jgi:transcriptional regulator with XRE-family HTH domain